MWDRDAYFRVNYPAWTNGTWTTQTGLPSNATRYQVYAWEIANRDTVVGGQTVLATREPYGNGASQPRDHDKPICSNIQSPSYGTGLIPAANAVDRRRISVAVVNCLANSVNGASDNVPVATWLEVFLVEPSLNRDSGRTSRGDIYVEVIGETQTGSAARQQAKWSAATFRTLSSEMMNAALSLIRNENGAAGAEMALIVPLLVTLMFGSFEMGHFFWNEHKVVKAVRDGITLCGTPVHSRSFPARRLIFWLVTAARLRIRLSLLR